MANDTWTPTTTVVETRLFSDQEGRVMRQRIVTSGPTPEGFVPFESSASCVLRIDGQPPIPGAEMNIDFNVPIDAETVEQAFIALPAAVVSAAKKAKLKAAEEYRRQVKQMPGIGRCIVPPAEELVRRDSELLRGLRVSQAGHNGGVQGRISG